MFTWKMSIKMEVLMLFVTHIFSSYLFL